MPVSFEFDSPSTCVVTATGDVTYVEVLDTLRELLDGPGLRPGCALVIIGVRVTDAPRIMELAGIARAMQEVFERGVRKVALSTDTELAQTAAKVFAAFIQLKGADAAVFPSAAEA